MKPYHQVPILECNEPLCSIPLEQFAVPLAHPYASLGAPYGNASPYLLRKDVVQRLRLAQNRLQARQPGWKIQIFDGYRPVAVQHFMVNYTLRELALARGLDVHRLDQHQHQTLLNEVYQFWAVPNPDPTTPPPHSTGAAVDVTLVDASGQPVAMGGDIDELSERSHPNYYGDRINPKSPRYCHTAATYHRHRTLLHWAMTTADFCRHPHEWWHFSYGDQLWAWLKTKDTMDTMVVARYGAVLD
ncbi:MAG: D-alanyl-D-alanine dipeptidase [Kaiparowitsia implicata GSE-PSE-MK54-09C]|jgi:D-alanyl-D-alanine dipeptidase|nr:D-alanyl-D-alanine dipeptidase [Kaiparowitsia implicata GSE-PSE-MK54-09C]